MDREGITPVIRKYTQRKENEGKENRRERCEGDKIQKKKSRMEIRKKKVSERKTEYK